jgi:hypothetical protein
MALLKFWFSVFMGAIKFGVLLFLSWVVSYYTGFELIYCLVILGFFINCVEHVMFDVKDK